MMRKLRIFLVFALYCALAMNPSLMLAQVIDQPAPVSVPTQTTGTTITTTAPVTNDTTISVGTIAGQALLWLVFAFSVPIGAFVVKILAKVAASTGITLDDARRQRLQEIIETGLHLFAASAARGLDGKVPFQAKGQLVNDVVHYVQTHGADTLKALGLDPQNLNTIEAIKARTEKALADPTVPVSVAPAPVTNTIISRPV